MAKSEEQAVQNIFYKVKIKIYSIRKSANLPKFTELQTARAFSTPTIEIIYIVLQIALCQIIYQKSEFRRPETVHGVGLKTT